MEERPKHTFMSFDPRITLGNVINIGVLLVTIVYAYSQLATRKEMIDFVAEVKREYVSREVLKLEIQLIGVEVKGLGTKLEEMRSELKEVRIDIKDIKRSVR